MELFSCKDAMDNKGISSVPKINGENYLIWESKMKFFLDSRQLIDVCLYQQQLPFSSKVVAKHSCSMFHLSSVVDDLIYNSIFKLASDLTPYYV
jgi:hypothetical protein